jgi:undecaprenyl-diphosphatase
VETWKTVVMGVVEGLTEFLPVSSTGHMILVGHWIRFPAELAKTFDVFIQLGAILAVVLYYRCRLAAWIATLRVAGAARHPIVLVGVAFLPAAALGFLTHRWIKAHLFHPSSVAAALIAGGFAMDWIERNRRPASTQEVEDMTMAQAVAVGAFQCLALFPGVSRSAATIMGGLLVGLSLPASAEFSFFLAIPTMCAASGYALLKVLPALSVADAGQLALGFGVAFVVALGVVASFIRYIQSHGFRPFAIYRIVLGAIVLAVARG